MVDVIKVGELVKNRRNSLGLKQNDLMEISGISNKTIQKIEMGVANPSLLVLSKILDVLGMEILISVKK